MIKVTIKNFQQNFCKLNSQELSVTKNGEVIGRWMPVGLASIETPQPSPTKEGGQIIPLKCAKCIKPALYRGSVWEEGEELNVFVCSYHFANQPQKKNFKKIL